MKQRPILFSAPMVRALLAGSKTQTRRAVAPAPEMVTDKTIAPWQGDPAALQRLLTLNGKTCRYGQPGDRLWVREAWKAHPTFDHLPPRDIPQTHIWYMADDGYKAESRYRQSMFMPRWASRITLEIVSICVERLQDISEADARAEGARECDPVSGREVLLAGPSQRGSYVLHYRDIWEQINGPGSWALNPWVWVVEFKRIAA